MSFVVVVLLLLLFFLHLLQTTDLYLIQDNVWGYGVASEDAEKLGILSSILDCRSADQ